MQNIYSQVETLENASLTDVLKDIRVLFADESHETIAIFKHIVNRLQWQGLYVHSSEQMIDTVNELLSMDHKLDAVVANISYLEGTQMTGITAAREIRKAMPNVPIVILSPYVTSMIREEVRRVGGEIMQKPFDPETLFVRLSQLIYWNRLASAQSYVGDDKRRNSINRSQYFRRATDYILSTPERIKQTLEELGGKI